MVQHLYVSVVVVLLSLFATFEGFSYDLPLNPALLLIKNNMILESERSRWIPHSKVQKPMQGLDSDEFI